VSKHSSIDLTSLVKRCLNHDDEKAWNILAERISFIIGVICRKMRLSQEETGEISGRVFLKFLENLENIKTPDKLLSYVATVTRREIYEMFRKEKLHQRLTPEISEVLYANDIHLPDKMFESALDADALCKAMASLPEKDFQLLQMLFFEYPKPSYDQISIKMKIKVSSIGPTRARIIDKLRKYLNKRGYKGNISDSIDFDSELGE